MSAAVEKKARSSIIFPPSLAQSDSLTLFFVLYFLSALSQLAFFFDDNMIENYADNASSLRHGTNNNEKSAVKNYDHLKRTSALFQEPKLEKALVRKLDRHILPLVCILYCFSFLDRVNIGNAK
jgi:hypothetical protein